MLLPSSSLAGIFGVIQIGSFTNFTVVQLHLTRHKISDREPTVAGDAGKRWLANTHKVDRRLARGSLHRLVRRHSPRLRQAS